MVVVTSTAKLGGKKSEYLCRSYVAQPWFQEVKLCIACLIASSWTTSKL